jgi:hypothetical protein
MGEAGDTLEAIEEGFRRRRRRFRVVVGVAGACAAVGIVVALALLLRSTPEQKFRRSALGEALSTHLTDYVVYSARSRPLADAARKELLSSRVERALGPEAYGAFSTALDVAVRAQRSHEDVDAAMAPLFRELDAVDRRLSETHQPAFVTAYAYGSPGERTVWITSYYVRARAETVVDGARGRVVWGERLDSLNLTDLLAWKADASEWTLLSVDLIEEDFVRTLLKAVAVREPLRGMPEATAAVAGEIYASSKLTQKDAAAIDDWLGRRNLAALDLKAAGYAIDTTDRLQLPNWAVRELEGSRGRAVQVDTMLRMNEALGAYREGFSSAVDLLASLHEQEFLVRLLEAPHQRDSSVQALAAQGVDYPDLRAAASSVLALLARPQVCPRLALWRAAAWAYDDRLYNVAMRRVGIVILGALMRELGLPDENEWAGQTPADDKFAAALRAAIARPPADVQAAAGRAYAALFGHPPPSYSRTLLP